MYLEYLFSYDWKKINKPNEIGILTWNPIIVYKLLELKILIQN